MAKLSDNNKFKELDKKQKIFGRGLIHLTE